MMPYATPQILNLRFNLCVEKHKERNFIRGRLDQGSQLSQTFVRDAFEWTMWIVRNNKMDVFQNKIEEC